MTHDDGDLTRDQVLALEEARHAAMIDGRLRELERMFADDMIYTYSSSIAHDKVGYIQAIRDGEFGYTSIARSETTNIAFETGAVLLTGRIKLDAVFVRGFRAAFREAGIDSATRLQQESHATGPNARRNNWPRLNRTGRLRGGCR